MAIARVVAHAFMRRVSPRFPVPPAEINVQAYIRDYSQNRRNYNISKGLATREHILLTELNVTRVSFEFTRCSSYSHFSK